MNDEITAKKNTFLLFSDPDFEEFMFLMFFEVLKLNRYYVCA